MTITELYAKELAFWTVANQSFLGLTPIDENDNFADIQASIDRDCEKYWNTDSPCKLARYFNNGVLNYDASKQTKNSYQLKLNFHSMCVDISGDYNGKRLKLGAMPLPCIDLCWIINRTHYVTRVTAVKDFYGALARWDFQTIRGDNGWKYDIPSDTFECTYKDPKNQFEPTKEEVFNNLTFRSKCLLMSILKEPLTLDNFTEALRQVPKFRSDSIFNYKFSRMEYFEDIILNSKKFAQPTKKILLGINTIIASKAKQYTTSGENLEGCLVRSESLIFALENFRTCVNIYNGNDNAPSNHYDHNSDDDKKTKFKPAFTYTDTNGFFDSFKTVTSQSAGRQRLLLDNVVTKKGMLWIVDENGVQKNMYEYFTDPQKARLSCLSKAPFGNNDKPKRIMMNAKMTSQAVPLAEEIDPLTHRIKARVCFCDIEGYTAADSMIISKSFAERLRTFDKTILYLNKNSKDFALIAKQDFNLEALKQLFPNKSDAVLSNYENFKIDRFDEVDKNNIRVFLSWEIPFRLGDKITNLHGAKGTVGLILPDDQMPRLLHDVGDMKAGPMEIVISGFSTMRRGSLGQIFEAWALASNIEYGENEDFIAIMIERYADQMKEYAKNSVLEYKGQKQTVPVGLNYIMRLYHHAATHISESSADSAYGRTLKFGEMEKMNLVANDCPNILKELGIRSVTKYIGSHRMIADMQETRELPENTRLSLNFIEVVKSMGYSISIENNVVDYKGLDERDLQQINSIMGKEEDSNEDNSEAD